TTKGKNSPARIFSYGPGGITKECQRITADLGYLEHMVHFESFGSGGDNLGDPFEVDVQEPKTNGLKTVTVPCNKTLLDVLNEADFSVLYSCKSAAREHGAVG
ncbi:hypothetical protein ACHAP5_011866, partial [Fusarium lateritium]